MAGGWPPWSHSQPATLFAQLDRPALKPLPATRFQFTQQQEEPQTAQLSFEERFALLVDRQWNSRQNRALERRLKDSRVAGNSLICGNVFGH